MGYVFISYSTDNQSSAEALRNLFSKHGYGTWMATYDIPPGMKFAEAINQAIKGCDCFVLLLTNQSQNSKWVAKEVERAIHYRKLLIPISLENVILNDEFEFYISTDQIIPVKTISEDSVEIKKILQTLSIHVSRTNANVPTEKDAPKVTSDTSDSSITARRAKYKSAMSDDFGRWRTQDFKQAIKQLLRDAKQGDSLAQLYLGDCYYNGLGVKECKKTAAKWYARSAHNGEVSAQFKLGMAYYYGWGVDSHDGKAVEWLTKAANSGLSDAQYMLGWYYFGTFGTHRDYAKAFYWLKLAAEQGNKYAYSNLAECYEKGLGTPVDTLLADYWNALAVSSAAQ